MQQTEAVDNAGRFMQICNACRYCEGYCAVFPAMELRTAFTSEDLAYLANLCHNCRGCLYACQYAPPHEFGINLPRTFSQVRHETYKYYAWPGCLARLFDRNGMVVSLATALALSVVLLLVTTFQPSGVLYAKNTGPGAFYRIIPFFDMASVAAISILFSAVAIAVSVMKFWRDTGGKFKDICDPLPVLAATSDAMTLKYLGGSDSGGGCNDKNEKFSTIRRRYHHSLFYGFLLCTASTMVAAFYEHILHRIAPYPLFSVPVLLGTAGGVAMLIGCGGLLSLKITADQTPAAHELLGTDIGFILLLGLSALTGLLLLALRSTNAMGVLLAIHLGCILALFVILPYSKFVHGAYRLGALLRFAIERPNQKSNGSKMPTVIDVIRG
jgi:citrate/tricarballylate utilization protein